MKTTDPFDVFTDNLTFNELAAHLAASSVSSSPAPPHQLTTSEAVWLEACSVNGNSRLTIKAREAEQLLIGDVLHAVLTSLFGPPLMDCRPEPDDGVLKLTGWRPEQLQINQMIMYEPGQVEPTVVQTLLVKRAA